MRWPPFVTQCFIFWVLFHTPTLSLCCGPFFIEGYSPSLDVHVEDLHNDRLAHFHHICGILFT